MVKREASLAGRGVEILFGEKQPSQPRPAPTSGESSPPPRDAEEPMDEEWAAMLEEEAATATGSVEAVPESGAPPVKEPEVSEAAPAEPEAKEPKPDFMAVPVEKDEEEELISDEDLPPLATTPAQPAATSATPAASAKPVASASLKPASAKGPETPPAPMYTDAYAAPEPTAPLPPPREKPEATDPVVRAKLMGMLYSTPTVKPTDEQLAPEGPETPEFLVQEVAAYETGQPSRTREEHEVLEYVGLKQRQDLWREINELYRIVPDVLCTDANQPRALLLLQEAQDLLLEKPRQFDVARYKVGQARSIVNRRLNTSKWANTYGWGAFAYETLWIAILVLAILFSQSIVTYILGLTQGEQAISQEMLLALWTTMAWGGLGGVIGAFYSLYWHAAKVQDFDKQYMMWYIVQPIIGLLIGGLVHLFIGSGFIVARGETASGSETAISLFPYAVAAIAGFRQRFILEIIDRMIQLLTPAPQESQSQPQEPEIEEGISPRMQ